MVYAVNDVIYIFRCLGRSKVAVQFQGLCNFS